MEQLPGTLSVGLTLEARSALEIVQQISLRKGTHRTEQDAGWCSAGRQGTTGEGMAWWAGQMDGCSKGSL